MTAYHLPNGTLSSFPTTIELAIKLKSVFYNDGVKCKECGVMSVKYVHDSSCRFCVMQKAVNFYNMYVGSQLVYVDENTNKPMYKVMGKPDAPIAEDDYAHMLNLLEIAHSDVDYKVTVNGCKKAPHVGLKKGGKCYECEVERLTPTARQQALMDGRTWYVPEKHCPKCFTMSERNVHNGRCKGCVKPTEHDERATPDTIMMREAPDMVISKEDAAGYGLKVYRTGEPCRRGHYGWRYISTGNCIDCLRMKDDE